jgi:hypothetical protein
VALNRAALTYGSLLAGAGNYLPDFVRRWNERFSESGQAVARQSNHRGVQLAEVQFEGAGQSVYLATPAEGAAVSGESLAQAVNKKGARVVETDRVGNVSYVLGGKSVTRIVPELLSGAAFLLWLGASSLAPPSGVAVVGFLSFVVVGGMSVRGLFMVSTYWHGLGHALAARVFAKKPVRDSLAEYSQNIPLGQLAPFSSFFLPGVTSPEQAPHFSVDRLAPWKLRLAALSGPLMNLAVVVSLVPFLSATGPVSLQKKDRPTPDKTVRQSEPDERPAHRLIPATAHKANPDRLTGPVADRNGTSDTTTAKFMSGPDKAARRSFHGAKRSTEKWGACSGDVTPGKKKDENGANWPKGMFWEYSAKLSRTGFLAKTRAAKAWPNPCQ